MDPHSTSTKGRTCLDCHQNPKTLGLGEGNLWYADGRWHFSASSRTPEATITETLSLISRRSKAPAAVSNHDRHTTGQKPFVNNHPLDAFVDIDGNVLVHTSRKGLRPFDKKEIDRILYVGLCVTCHRDFKDPVMKNWQRGHAPRPCKNAIGSIPMQ